jgi:hypothetical protein
MLQLLVPALAVLTSVGAYWIGRRLLGLPASSLRPALARALQLVGVSVVFFLANLVVGLVVVGAVRGLTPWFLSVYFLSDVGLPILSVLQGLLFECWRGGTPPPPR